MSRPRKPLEELRITGALERSPGRYKDRSEPDAPGALGSPPAWLSEAQKRCWTGFAHELPWLTYSDTGIVTLASLLRARVVEEPDCPIGIVTQLRLCLTQMGATPATRSKVPQPEDQDDDPASEFFQ